MNKVMHQSYRLFSTVCLVGYLGLSLTACSKPEPPKPIVSEAGRPETRSVEAANAIGYNGTAMRQKLDKALDANDAQTQKMNQAANQ